MLQYNARIARFPLEHGSIAGDNSDMAVDNELLQRSLSLSPKDRIELAGRLLSSVDEDSDDVLRAWSDELDRRADEIDQGKPVTADRETVMRRVREAAQRQRQAS